MKNYIKPIAYFYVCLFACTLSAKNFAELAAEFTLPTFKRGNPERNKSYQDIAQNFGNKTANLCILKALAEQINKATLHGSHATMSVPEFYAFSSDEIKKYLNIVFKLDELWQQFVAAQGSAKELTPAAQTALEEIRANIRKAFTGSEQVPADIAAQLEPFFKEHAGSLLMVRSTGDEDRTDIANAGGNESVPSVQPNLEAVWNAMGVVVESYFSEKSLQQRLLAGDNITKHCFIPVLIQRMIGEQEVARGLKDIPVSGVMFTQEAQGNTPGVVQIQSAYGHNQGVVNSLVAVDTYYVGPSSLIHAVIVDKKERLMSIKHGDKYALEMVANTHGQKQPSLNAGMVQDLKKIADQIQKTYDYPMDIEFVVQHNIIYLVQARPIVQKKWATEPNYLDDAYVDGVKKHEAASGSMRIVAGISIGIAGGFVREITSADQVIIRDELPQALNNYHANNNRSIIKAVIVTKMAPSTSHEATQFRGYSVPVIVIPRDAIPTVEAWLSSRTVLLDTQRALVVQQEDEAPGDSIKNGWYTHPIALQESVMQLFLRIPTAHYTNYLKELEWQKTDIDTATDSVRTLIEQVKTSSDRATVLGNLKRIVHRVSNFTHKKTDVTQQKSLIAEGNLVLLQARMCAAEILQTLDILAQSGADEASKRLQYLFPIKFLETTMFQQADPDVVDGLSYLLLAKMMQQEIEAIKTVSAGVDIKAIRKKTLEYIVQLTKANQLALNTETRTAWNSFAQGLVKLASMQDKKEREHAAFLIGTLGTDIAQLRKLNVLDLWINSSFVDAWQKDKDASKVAQALIDEIQAKANKESIAWVDKQKGLLATWEKKLDDWGQPEKFAKLFKQFNDQFITEFISGKGEAHKEFDALMYGTPQHTTIADLDYEKMMKFAQTQAPLVSKFFAADKLGKLILLRLMQEVIGLYDHSIKAVTGSPVYKDNTARATNFRTLLVPYVALMEEMVALLKENEQELMPTKIAGGYWSFDRYLRSIRGQFASTYQHLNPDQLLKASPNFSVAAGQIGSMVNYERATPVNLEDIFTLAHQNMLMTLSVANKKYGIKPNALPILVQKISTSLNEIGAVSSYHSNLTGIDYHFPQITVYYNVPIRNHSSTFEIQYDMNKPDQAILACKFLGHNGGNRMIQIAAFANLASMVSGLNFDKIPYSTATDYDPLKEQHITEFAWIITDNTNLDEVQKYIRRMISLTLNALSTSVDQDDHKNMLLDVHQIKEFLPPSRFSPWIINREDKNIEGRKETINALHFTQDFFDRELYFNDWLIDQYVATKEYKKALWLMKKSVDKIIKQQMFKYTTKIYGIPLMVLIIKLLPECIEEPSTSQQAKELAIEILSSKKIIPEVLEIYSPSLIQSIANLFIETLKESNDANVFESFKTFLNHPKTVEYLLTNKVPNKTYPAHIEQILNRKQGEKAWDAYYEKILNYLPAIIKKKQKYQSTEIGDIAKYILGPLITDQGARYPQIYTLAYGTAMNWIDELKQHSRTSYLKSIELIIISLKKANQKEILDALCTAIYNKAMNFSTLLTKEPYRYEIIKSIADILKETGKQKEAQEIQDALDKKLAEEGFGKGIMSEEFDSWLD